MIFKVVIRLLCVGAVLLLLSGCPGQDENRVQSGLTVHIAEVHLEQQLPTVSRAATTTPPAVSKQLASVATTLPDNADLAADATITPLAVTGGYNHDLLEHHDIIDNNSHLLSIYRAYVVLDEFELVSCTSLSQLPDRILNWIIPTAAAHAGHGAEPVGGRNLDQPNVIDMLTQDEYLLALGDLAVAPGRYCGIRVSFTRLGSTSYGKPDAAPASDDDPTTTPEVPDLSGRMFALRADYCSTTDAAGNCLGRSKVDIDDTGLALPPARTIRFAQPLELNHSLRSGYVAVGIAYGQWARDVDVALLASDLYQRQKFLNNVAASVHVYVKGLGDLPINVTL